MRERSCLNEKDTLLLRGAAGDSSFLRAFQIRRPIDGGGSALCYEACHTGSGWGVLKEFYPTGDWNLKRDEQGQLHFHGERAGEREDFRRELDAYLQPFESLLQAKRNREGADLQTFIPAFELYFGTGDAQTAYVWTEGGEKTTFETLCREIQNAPEQQPERQLVKVLRALTALTKCLRTLHGQGLIHRDIKPGNFGFSSLDQQPQTQNISLFDINTVCSLNPLPRDYGGSEGFLEPWEPGYTAGCKTDLYAIGACLFYATVISEETRGQGYHYRQECFERLPELVASSRLLGAIESPSRGKLEESLTKILRRSLCRKKDRYASCEELLADLERALFYAEPILQTAQSPTGERWVLQDGTQPDPEQEARMALALRCHLYRHPLVACGDGKKPKEPRDLNVAVLGLGKYSQQFLDICLMVGQLPDYRLHVTVLAKDRSCWEDYLARRPGLREFFLIGSHDSDLEKHYGSILFQQAELSGEDAEQNRAILEDTILTMAESAWQPSYVFAALGAQELNLKAALACHEAAACLDMDFDIHFVWESRDLPQELPENLIPAQILADVAQTPDCMEMERMAFNVHLVWVKSLNLPFSEVRAEYREPYNHNSCVDYVLSLQAKLRSLGIDRGKMDPFAAAELFHATKLPKELRRELICFEHRRWVTEKLVTGWTPIRDLEDCLQTGTRDKGNTRHACIVRSTPQQPLIDPLWRADDHAKWDTATEQELNKLDELDRMSVLLHRVYQRRAQEIRRQGLLGQSNLEDLRGMLKQEPAALSAFQEWYSCVKEVWNGDYAKVRRYEGLLEALKQAAKKALPRTDWEYFKKHLGAFGGMFQPILKAVEYRDYKQDDVALIDSIPFILTYGENIYLAVPFAAGSNSRVFSNLAAAMMVNPSRLLLLAYVDTKQKLEELRKALPGMTAFMEKKKLRGGLELICACHTDLFGEFTPELEQEIKSRCGANFWQLRTMAVDTAEDCAPLFREYLQKRSRSADGRRLLALERNDTLLSYLLQGAGLYSRFPSYRFDPVGMCFTDVRGCQYLTYIRKRPSISVGDMSSLSGSFSLSSNNPEFYDSYQRLWNKYRTSGREWKALCGRLSDHAKENDVIARFERLQDWEKGTAVLRSYPICANCRTLRKIVSALVEHGIAEPESWVQDGLGGSHVVQIYDRTGQKAVFDRLFSLPDKLQDPERVSIHRNTVSRTVSVVFDDLVVTDLFLSEEQKMQFMPLLQFFASHNDIVNLRMQDNRASFAYTGTQMKELMTVAGKILEVYTFHKAKERSFDDVVSSYELLWGGSDVKSEFDCILTKGLCSLFVECKARNAIEQDFYFKLASLEQQFGINSRAVLIADTREKPHYDQAAVNAMQRTRGNMLDVITIWDPKEIDQIGQTLMEIIQGTYTPKNPQ